jgi:hypothetical protein
MDSRRRHTTSRIRLAMVLRGFALALVLLAAETFAVVHPLDLAAHGNGEPCKICVSVAGIGTGAVAQPLVFVVDAAPPALSAESALVFVAAQPVRPTARGPPLAS